MGPADFDEWLKKSSRTPLLMGILNVTPDSFSDGGDFLDSGRAIERGMRMLAEGASVIDIGGESTRPNSLPVDADEQIRRTIPVISKLAIAGATISIDTTSAAVAERAIDAGAVIINDVSAGRVDDALLPLAARAEAAIILMHMQGLPQSMQDAPSYEDVVVDISGFLKIRAEFAKKAGIRPHRVMLDVGIGFGKSLDHNLRLLRNHQRIADLGFPMVWGTSRKSFIGTLTDRPIASERVMGTAATIAWGLTNGADILRVHDVGAMREVVEVIKAIRSA